VIQALLASNILCLFISTEDSLKTSSRSLKSHSSSIWTMASSEYCRRAIFQIYNVQNLKITRITTLRICNVVYQAGSQLWYFTFFCFERTLYKSNYIIFILSWCGTHTKTRSKLFDIVTAGSQKITLWGPQAPLIYYGLMCRLSRNIGSLKLLVPYAPVQACNGVALPQQCEITLHVAGMTTP